MLRSRKALAAVLTVAVVWMFALPKTARAQGVIVPSTSFEFPGDPGERMHTNHLLYVLPAGGLGPSGGMSPDQVRSFYHLPGSGGSNVIAIVDAFHYPNALRDFNVFSAQFGLAQESSADPNASTNQVLQVVYANGTQPPSNVGWSQEAALDI